MWVTRQLHSRSVSLFSPSLWNASWWADWLQQVHADLILDEVSPQIIKESGKWLHVGDECISWLKLRWIHEKWLFDSVLLTPNNNNLFCRESSVKTVEDGCQRDKTEFMLQSSHQVTINCQQFTIIRKQNLNNSVCPSVLSWPRCLTQLYKADH